MSFEELARHEREGEDFRVVVKDRNSATTILAPHGGRIESGTSEIAQAVAGEGFNLYCFEGIKRSGNYALLHIASDRFDEPRCIRLVSRSRNVIAIHGCRGVRKSVLLGGRNEPLKRVLALNLREAGISVREEGHPFSGERPDNICNRGIEGEGIQCELTSRLRDGSARDIFIKTVRATLLMHPAVPV